MNNIFQVRYIFQFSFTRMSYIHIFIFATIIKIFKFINRTFHEFFIYKTMNNFNHRVFFKYGCIIPFISINSLILICWHTAIRMKKPNTICIGRIIQLLTGTYFRKQMETATNAATPYDGATSFICIQELQLRNFPV